MLQDLQSKCEPSKMNNFMMDEKDKVLVMDLFAKYASHHRRTTNTGSEDRMQRPSSAAETSTCTYSVERINSWGFHLPI